MPTTSPSPPPAPLYDSLAPTYNTWSTLPSEILSFRSIRRALGPTLANQTVLDLACGTGTTTKQCLDLGAAKVVGIDVSEGMVQIARSEMVQKEGRDVEFLVGDCSRVPLEVLNNRNNNNKSNRDGDEPKQFDLVTAMWLLPYAPSPPALLAMFTNISTHLRPGGRFVAINPPFTPSRLGFQARYGMTVADTSETAYGHTVSVDVHISPEMVRLEAHLLRREIYEECAKEVGLVGLRFEEPGWDVLEEGEERGFWEEWMREPSYLMVTARKKGEDGKGEGDV